MEIGPLLNQENNESCIEIKSIIQNDENDNSKNISIINDELNISTIKNNMIIDTPEPKYEHNMDIRPSKLKHIKNTFFLDNTFHPLFNKYVKKVWAYKKTKLDRTKRDLIWEYYRDRKRKPIANVLLETFYKNVRDVMIIYFDDPIQYSYTIDDEMAAELKKFKVNMNKKSKKTDEEKRLKKLRKIERKLAKAKKKPYKPPKKKHYKVNNNKNEYSNNY